MKFLSFRLRRAVNCWGWGFGELPTSAQKREVTIDCCFVVVVICDLRSSLIVITALLEQSEYSLSPKENAHSPRTRLPVWSLHVNKLRVYRIIHRVSRNSLHTLVCVHKTLRWDWFAWQALHFVSPGGLFAETVLPRKEMLNNRLDEFQRRNEEIDVINSIP